MMMCESKYIVNSFIITSFETPYNKPILVLILFLKCCRQRGRRNKSKKYGLITMPDDQLEMRPLDNDDDEDEDMTVFERTTLKKNDRLTVKPSTQSQRKT